MTRLIEWNVIARAVELRLFKLNVLSEARFDIIEVLRSGYYRLILRQQINRPATPVTTLPGRADRPRDRHE